MTPRQLAAVELLRRRNARRSLLDFILYLNPEYIVSDFVVQVTLALEKFVKDQQAGRLPLLILQAPPQHGKSDIVSRYFPAWVFGNHPNSALAGLSYAKDLASDMNRDVQRIMTSAEYGRLFPESTLNKRRSVASDVEVKRNSETFDIQGHKGRYIAQGVGGPLTGKRVDIGVIDDPIKNSKEALSKVVKNALWDWYTTVFLTRLSRHSGQIIMATSWATDDLSGRAIAAYPNATVLKFKAIEGEGTDNERALVPELHPLEKLQATRAVMSAYFWSAMYQQAPKVLGGDIIHSEQFRLYSVTPELRYRKIYGDTAMKTEERHDYSVLQCWGSTGSAIYLIDQIRGKWEAPELQRRAAAFWNKHKALGGPGMGELRQMMIEDKASGTGLIQSLRVESSIPITGISRAVDKLTRVMDGLGYIESGRVHLPELAPWLSDYLTECDAFTADDSHDHDDQLDPTFDAIKDMLSTTNAPLKISEAAVHAFESY